MRADGRILHDGMSLDEYGDKKEEDGCENLELLKDLTL